MKNISLTDRFDLLKSKKTKETSEKTQKPMEEQDNGWIFALSGTHGVGKTTLYHLFQKNFKDRSNVKIYPERLQIMPPVPFGSKNPQTAFRAELHYNQQMLERNRLVKEFITNQPDHIAIIDRSPLSTIIYSKALNLPKIDYGIIEDTFKSISWVKEHIFYLEADPETIMKRIYRRGSLDPNRKEWNEKDYDYLLKIIYLYEEVFAEYNIYKKGCLHRIWTENKKPFEIYNHIIRMIEKISGLKLSQKISVPENQTKIISYY